MKCYDSELTVPWLCYHYWSVVRIRTRDTQHCTPLHMLFDDGVKLEVLRIMLDHDADVDVENENGSTPSQTSLKCGHNEVTQSIFSIQRESNAAEIHECACYDEVPETPELSLSEVCTRRGCSESRSRSSLSPLSSTPGRVSHYFPWLTNDLCFLRHQHFAHGRDLGE
ncbi:hypothetical protein EI94DRAFT_1279529 [Lactarius quietus]|nr:hypothetical protein EI94DRAFT_1279529 [Lactarius quietus]